MAQLPYTVDRSLVLDGIRYFHWQTLANMILHSIEPEALTMFVCVCVSVFPFDVVDPAEWLKEKVAT